MMSCIMRDTIRKTDTTSGQVYMYVLLIVKHVRFNYFSVRGYVQHVSYDAVGKEAYPKLLDN